MVLFDPSTVAGMVHQYGSSKATTFSGSFAESNEDSLAAFAETQSQTCRSRLLGQIHGFCFVDDTNKIRKISCIKWVTDMAGEQLIVGSLGDSLEQAFPVSVSGDALDPKHFITLGPAGMVTQLSLPHIPTLLHEPSQEPDPIAINDSNRSIHWDAEDDQGLPVFMAYMSVYPLPEGIDLPLEGHDLSGPLPTSWTNGVPQPYVAWVQGIKYLIDHNKGRSLHFEHTMFKASSVPVDKFGGVLSLVSSPTINFTTLDIASPHHQEVLKKFNADRKAAYLRVSRAAVIDRALHQATGQPTDTAQMVGHAVLVDAIKELAENNKMTGAERERSSHQKEVTYSYSILWAHRNKTTNAMEPTTLSKLFTDIEKQNRSCKDISQKMCAR
eukprot:scaffold19716_cov59-Cylindrotheca_fusiformis.AAC.1